MSFTNRVKGFVIFIFLLWALGHGQQSFAQTPGTNYVRTREPQIAVTDTSLLDTIPAQRQTVAIQYSDGLGRTLQSIQLQGSPKYNDVIMPYFYDNMGRLTTMYLPYVDVNTTNTTTGTFRANGPTNVLTFYNPSSPRAPKIPTDVSPYAQTVYEASPLARVVEQGEVGATFQPGTGHTVKASYNINSLSDSIKYYYNIVEGVSISISPFAAGVLTQTIITDENGHRLAVWHDLQGRTVTRTQLDAPTPYYSTDYVYNDLNELSYIVTPADKKYLAISKGSFEAGFANQTYIFHYDSIGRMVEKKVPGKGWIYTIYNHSDRPVLSQDSNMRAKKQWSYFKYDAEGRIVQTGIYINTIITNRKALQYYCDINFAVLWETWQPGTGYTNNAFPQQSAIPGSTPLAIYTIFYYDDYSFTEAASKPFQTNVYGTSQTLRTMGMLTGTSVYVLGTTNQRLVTVNYFDNQDRLIQQIADNHLGQVDVVNNQYNFNGQLTGSQRTIVPIAGSTYIIKDRFIYDQLDRLMDTYESFQGGAEIDISHNVYNEISQKVSEGLHSTNYNSTDTLQYTGVGPMPSTIADSTALTTGQTDIASTNVTLNPGFSFTATTANSYLAGIGYSFAQTQEFRYDIKSELTSINNGTLTYDNGVTQSDPNALFGESITYSQSSPISASPEYNGNISGMTWRNKIEQTGLPGVVTGGQGYTFNYDNTNRLTQSSYYTRPGTTWIPSTTGALTEKIPGYDEMGNIDSLQRRDITGSLLNKLTYTYQTQGNQLASVSDAGSKHISGTYTYDGNGNMISDSRKGITITYNYLDLPDTVKQGTSKLVFTYDADGNKLYKQAIVAGSVVSQRHYVDDVEVTATSSIAYDGRVENVKMDEGRIVNTGSGNFQYEYYLQDHLFTNRVNFRVNTDGSVCLIRVQNYYPFGGDMGDSTMNYAATSRDYYRYEDKELQPELNLDTYDFGFRHYDPVLGRWVGVDALAEESDELSPYNYVENNPMSELDPDGMQPNSGNDFTFIPSTTGDGGISTIGTGSMESVTAGGLAGAAGWGVAGASGILQGASAYGAFGWGTPKATDWNNLGKVQGNGRGFTNPLQFTNKQLSPKSTTEPDPDGDFDGPGSFILAGYLGWKAGSLISDHVVDHSLPMAIGKFLVDDLGVDPKVLFDPALNPYSPPKPPHGNSDDNNDPHLVYEIFSIDKETGGDLTTEKYGITGRRDRPDARPQYQVNSFNKKYPKRHYDWRKVTKTPNRIEAKIKESELVLKYKITHKGRLPREQYRPNPPLP